MTQQLQVITPERADQGLEWLKHSLPLLQSDQDTRARAERAVAVMSEPSQPAQTMARVLALLYPYYDKDTPQAVREMEAEDWAEELDGLPFWAIEAAARWWKSKENADRRRRPFEGDISAKAFALMDPVRAARHHLARPIRSAPSAPIDTKPAPRPTAEAANAILAAAGFTPKVMPK